MLVVSFAARPGKDNCVMVDDLPYVYARTECGEFVLPARCPHRGGPLHLASFEPGRTRLVCPWHERATSVTRLLRAGIPAVRRGDTVTAVLPVADGAPHRLEHRPMSEGLSWEGGSR